MDLPQNEQRLFPSNRLPFVTETESVCWAVRTEPLYKIQVRVSL